MIVNKIKVAKVLRKNVTALYGSGSFDKRMEKRICFHLLESAMVIKDVMKVRAQTIVKQFMLENAWRL